MEVPIVSWGSADLSEKANATRSFDTVSHDRPNRARWISSKMSNFIHSAVFPLETQVVSSFDGAYAIPESASALRREPRMGTMFPSSRSSGPLSEVMTLLFLSSPAIRQAKEECGGIEENGEYRGQIGHIETLRW